MAAVTRDVCPAIGFKTDHGCCGRRVLGEFWMLRGRLNQCGGQHCRSGVMPDQHGRVRPAPLQNGQHPVGGGEVKRRCKLHLGILIAVFGDMRPCFRGAPRGRGKHGFGAESPLSQPSSDGFGGGVPTGVQRTIMVIHCRVIPTGFSVAGQDQT